MLPICPYYKNGDEEMRFTEVAFSEQRSSPSKLFFIAIGFPVTIGQYTFEVYLQDLNVIK
jgi:hypothetical protein